MPEKTKPCNLKVLLAGGTGFAGVHIAKALLEKGSQLHVIARDEQKLFSMLGDEYRNRVKVLQADLLNPSDLERLTKELAALERFDVVIQTVGGGPLTCNPQFTATIFGLNYRTTTNLIEVLERSQQIQSLRLFVYFSSLAAMGIPSGSANRIVYNEVSDCNPVLPYERAKFETEVFLKKLSAKHPFKIVVLRFPQIYGGPNDAFMQMIHMIRKGIFPVIRGRDGTLPLISVQDVVGATVTVLQKIDDIRQNYTIHLICEGSQSYSQLVDLVKRKYGEAGVLSVPYPLMYFGTWMMERIFGLLGKPEPLNRRRLLSLTKDRVVDCKGFVTAFGFQFGEDVGSFIARQTS